MEEKQRKPLGLKELIAIAVGGMIGGGIFTILGIAVSLVGFLAPWAIALGGVVAFFAAYAYVQLGVYFRDEGATYAFFKRSFLGSHLAASFIGWYTSFGYIATLALYAYTFSAYANSGSIWAEDLWVRKGLAIAVLWIFALINIWSVRGMGKIEDVLVYAKLTILAVISMMLLYHTHVDWERFVHTLAEDFERSSVLQILTVTAVTFVAYEGFQLVINAVRDMEAPERNIPRAIYGSIVLVSAVYFIMALAAVLAIPVGDLIRYKEYALAAGAEAILGNFGRDLVTIGAVFATSSAIGGTMFGASRQMARIADDGYFPTTLSVRKGTIPTHAILAMAGLASLMVLAGGLRLILEFGSITFLLISMLMAIANYKMRLQTGASKSLSLLAIAVLAGGTVLIFAYEYHTKPLQMAAIILLYIILSISAWLYSHLGGTRDSD